MENKTSSYLKLGEMFDDLGIRQDLWIEWRHDKRDDPDCCPVCKVLDRCWFLRAKMPQQPQHPYCHCTVMPISNPVPHKNAKAVCPVEKFTGYIFNPKYDDGKEHMFIGMGYSVKDSERLRQEYEKQAVEKYCKGEYSLGDLDEYGQRINIYIDLENNGIKRTCDTGWMVRPNGLITNNTPYASKER